MEEMQEKEKVESDSRRINPLLVRLVFWPGIVALLVWQIVGQVPPAGDVDFHLAGNRTNLYVAAASNPSGEADEGVLVYSRLGARGKWSPQARRRHDANLLQTVAWQEDLIVLYDSGGMFFVGPSDFYQSPPLKSWQPIAVAANERTVMALALGEDGKPLFSRLSKPDQWGTVEPVEMVVDWTAETARLARAAVREADGKSEFHVVWTEPVASSPIGEEPQRRKLRFAWRDGAGTWKGPFDDPSINPAGPLSLAAVGPRLGMVYLAAPPASQSLGRPRLVYARYFPDDGRWHVVPEVEFALDDDRFGEIESYGLARFRDGLVVVVRDESGESELFRLDPQTEQVTVDRQSQPPKLIVPVTNSQRTIPPTNIAIMALAVVLVMVLSFRAFRRRAMREGESPEEAYRQRMARVAAYQVEKLMYLPVLFWRSLAFLIDSLIIVALIGAVVGIVRPELLPRTSTDFELFFQDWSSLRVIESVLMCAAFVYFTAMELLWNRTVGKMLCGLKVVDLAGGRPAWWRIVDRNLIRPFDSVMAIGLLVIMWTPRSQ
ncbi:MAG: hypothetical protein GWP05_08115, partial [Anaerolineaceae bacterium]|nr:hypothetical protein [Anaerolineaceae bacterium]